MGCQKTFDLLVNPAVPPSYPPFLYADYSFQPYLSGDVNFDWNRTLAFVAGPGYQALNIGAPGQNFMVSYGAGTWTLLVNGGPIGPITLQYARADGTGLNPQGTYTWIASPLGPYPLPPGTINLLTTSPIQITTASPLPDGGTETAYSEFLVVTGNVSVPAFTLVGGALPAGLGLGIATGEISGTPTVLGTFNFTVRATDSAGHVDKAFDLTVNLGLTISTTDPLPKGISGQAYSKFIVAANNSGAVTWTLQAGALPDGLGLNGATGEISGTPTVVNTFNFTIRATDGLGFVDKAFACEILADIPNNVQVSGTLTIPTGFTCLFGGGVTLDGTTQAVSVNVTLGKTSPMHYDDGSGSFTMDLSGGLWAITSIGGIYAGPPLGDAPFAIAPVALADSGNCGGASQALFDVDSLAGQANLLGAHTMTDLISYTDVSLPTPLQTDAYASGILTVVAL